MVSFLLVLLLVLFSTEAKVKARADSIEDVTNCLIIIEDKVYNALRQVESDGDLCKIDGDKIGPYQLSRQYYDEAVAFDIKLSNEGERQLDVFN